RIAYRALMLSVDATLVSMIGFFVAINIVRANPSSSAASLLFGFITIGFILSFFVGLVSLVLNIPVFRKISRERAKLNELGLGSLSKSLWKESRRSQWMRRARSILLIVIAVYFLISPVGYLLVILSGTLPHSRVEGM